MYKIIRLVLIIFTFSYFLGILWHIMVTDILETIVYPDGTYEENFNTRFLIHNEGADPLPPSKRLIMTWYFAFTTLATIGFGDFVPVSTIERWICSVILMFGVSIFSFIIGQFIDIMANYRMLWDVGNHKDLSKWISLLSRFNNGNPLQKELITQIEDFFTYYWENNRLEAFASESDARFYSELPDGMKDEILQYLFADFLYKYKPYFNKLFTKGLDYYIQKKKRQCKLDHPHNMLTCQSGATINKQGIE